jgi:hypothetical protein
MLSILTVVSCLIQLLSDLEENILLTIFAYGFLSRNEFLPYLLAANPYIETDYGEFIRGKEGSNLI